MFWHAGKEIFSAGIYLLKVKMETLEQGVKYDAIDVILVSFLLTLNIFYTLF